MTYKLLETLLSRMDDQAKTDSDLTKSLDATGKADDAAIQAAAAAAGATIPSDDEDGKLDAEDGDKDDLDEDGKPKAKVAPGEMTKSFSFTLANGEVVEAMDGTAMIKVLSERIDTDRDMFTKALTASLDLIKGQSAMIQTLNTRFSTLAGQGAGRKTVLTVVEKNAPAATELAKSQAEQGGVTTKEFFAKANVAQQEGRVTAAEIGLAETYLNRGSAVPAHILQRVMG